jgi:CRP/FNR family transcriptional regulator
MEMGRVAATAQPSEDPLTYLSRKPVQEFGKGQTIYDSKASSDHLYVVIRGRVKVTSIAEDGGQTVARIVSSDGLFGEVAMVGAVTHSERAVALDAVSLMGWSRSEIEAQIEREPRLGVGLTQYLVRQCLELKDRIESMAIYKTPERVILALVQLAESQGTAMPDGSTRIQALTHHTIAEFVGTSREIVTFHMNRLRRLGLVTYSRRFIDVYVDGLKEALRAGYQS